MSYRNQAARPRTNQRRVRYPRCLGIAAVALAAAACEDPREADPPPAGVEAPASFVAPPPPPPTASAEPVDEIRLGGVAPVPFEANSAK